MSSQLTGAISTVPGLMCPVDIVNPVVLYLHYNNSLGYYDGIAWECTVDPEHHHGIVYPLPQYISAVVTKKSSWNGPRIGALFPKPS